jgi:hypothetical protein
MASSKARPDLRRSGQASESVSDGILQIDRATFPA